MININIYITEKLKLNKDSKLSLNDDFNSVKTFIEDKFNNIGYEYKLHNLNHHDDTVGEYILVVIKKVLQKLEINKIVKEINKEFENNNLPYKCFDDYAYVGGVRFATNFTIFKIK
jgi:hypothetical protein